ncbi:alkaline phosphatase family protein [Halovivax gelatinilyticus]|uniref:alkaline phosphatase family protein n=1 Tax=Halovivax gelatinilyticus TaxID=2961597 RepID=UPI0020CA8E86|nr:alkaline phosphatase family protein [Halovivax gelatinilyticus]
MSRREIEERVGANRERDAVVEPDYGGYCVSNVVESLLGLLDSRFDAPMPEDVFRGVDTDVETVVFVLLDGLGYDEWTRFESRSTLARRFAADGTVSPLTSIFPSETAAAFTSIATGTDPIEHGLLGWFQYLGAIERDVVTLPFTTLTETPIGDVDPTLDGSALFDATALSARTAETDLSFEAVLPSSIVESPYSRAIFDGAARTGFDERESFARRLRDSAESADGPTFVFGYEPSIDAAAHEDGLRSRATRSTATDVLAHLQSGFVERLSDDAAAKTLLVVSADHGIVDTVPAENVDVTDWPSWPDVRRWLRRDRSNEPRRPTGSPRNMHLHVDPDHVADVNARLAEAVDGRVYTRSEAVDAGLFGEASPSALFERRCGDLLAVHRNRGLCWIDRDLNEIGMHGGLTREEMLVPFAVGRVEDLRG